MDFNDLVVEFLVISRSIGVLGSLGHSFLPVELRAAFCWFSAKQGKSGKKDVLPGPRSNLASLLADLCSRMTCSRTLASLMTTGRRPVSQLESRKEIGLRGEGQYILHSASGTCTFFVVLWPGSFVYMMLLVSTWPRCMKCASCLIWLCFARSSGIE